MISVAEALGHIFDLVSVKASETVSLRNASGRVLAQDVFATRSQPPFPVSVMDGYAVAAETVAPGDRFHVIGEAAAGHAFDGQIGGQDCVRIFTGARVPVGAKRVIIQEDALREGADIVIGQTPDMQRYIRPEGADFKEQDPMTAPRRLTPSDVALLASMNISQVPVAPRPIVAILATGDELVLPGETPGPSQIIASNNLGIGAMLAEEGAEVRQLPVARDTVAALQDCFELAEGADVIVTIGGASVGDHDLVGQVAAARGMDRAFYKIAMRPGKPLMAGRMGTSAMVGLPGNPVSSMVCSHLFLRPMIRAMQGLPQAALKRETGILETPIGPNGPREHYMRAILGTHGIRVTERQDSSLLSVLADSNCLVVRPPNAPACDIGDSVQFIHF